MITYIKIDIEGFYVTFNEQLNKKLYNNIGTTWDDFCNGFWVKLNSSQLNFHKENPDASIEEVFFMKIKEKKSIKKSLDDLKFDKINNVKSYDKSSYVNQFFINDKSVWFFKEERASLMMRFNAEKKNGIKTTKIWFRDYEFLVPIDKAIDMIYSVELYASKCYDRTKEHIVNIKNLTTEEEINNYNVTVGYPEKLRFNYA